MRIRKLVRGNRNIVGETLERIRKSKGLRCKEAVAQLNVAGINIDSSALSKIEGGHRSITDVELLAFSTVYDISLNDIFRMSLNN